MTRIDLCSVCGGSTFICHEILWDELIAEWELTPYEVSYINRQQGFCCDACGNNMRSLALAEAVLRTYCFFGTLNEFIRTSGAQKLRILEINEAGGLTASFSALPLHRIVRYPDYDITRLRIKSSSYDLVIHSDTLEHVPDPIAGLRECFRVLDNGGHCIFTIPLVVGRLSRTRQDMKNSFHGNPNNSSLDYKVHTEFGSDVWKYVIEAGFSNARIHSLEYPAALAIEATKF